MTRLFVSCLMAVVCAAPLRAVVIARAGKPAVVIAVAGDPTPPECFAAGELALHLEQITGGAFNILPEDELDEDAAAVFVGHTMFAAAHGIDAAAMGEEESLIRTVGDHLVLTGGRPRGTLYAVYEFLERDLGVAWLSETVTLLPRRPDMAIGNLSRRRSPAFKGMRYIYTDQRRHNHSEAFFARMKLWHSRNRIGAGAWVRDDARLGVRRPGSPNMGHSFYAYLPPEDYFDEHPEWFSAGAGGERQRGRGQLCLTNRDMRAEVIRRMREFIVKDRARAVEEERPYPVLYDLGMNDYHTMCQCPECRKVVAREGAESGLVLEFVNAVADAIGEDYPDITIWTFAYSLTSRPPRTVRPRKNVMINLSLLTDHWRDPTKPLTADAHAGHRAIIEGWGRITDRIRIWDYWRLFTGDTFETPYTRVKLIQGDLQYLRALGVRDGYFVEFYGEERLSFVALTRWLGIKLMDDPDRDVEALIDRFMRAWYGPAAEPMRRWLEHLTRCLAANADLLTTRPVYRREYLNLDFFKEAYELFGLAEKRCKEGTPEMARTRAERLPVDTALLGLWDKLALELGDGQSMPWNRERVLERYIRDRKEVVRLRVPRMHGKALQEADKDEARLRLALDQPPLPEPFQSLPERDVVDVLREADWDKAWMKRRVIDDPASPGGIAMHLPTPADEPGTHIPIGLYTHPKKFGPSLVLTPATVTGKEAAWFEQGMGGDRHGRRIDIPGDEAYHWYKLGPFRIEPGTILHAHRSWYLGAGIDRPLLLGYPEEDWYVFFAFKQEGPAYVPGSGKENALYLGRIVLVRAANPRAADFMP